MEEVDLLLKDIEDFSEYNDMSEIMKESEEIINSLKNDGVDLSKEYDVSHILCATDFDCLDKCAVAIDQCFSGAIFSDVTEFMEDEKSKAFEMSVEIPSIVDLNTVEENIKKIVECCNKYNVAYDGWGVNIEE